MRCGGQVPLCAAFAESLLAGFARLGEDEGQSLVAVMKTSTLKSPSARTLSPSAAKLRLLKRLRCTLRYEKKAWESGALRVAGVDEVGRGSLFGCVVAAAVILDPSFCTATSRKAERATSSIPVANGSRKRRGRHRAP